MRLIYVVQRYGRDVSGGAETATHELATRLAARDHDVTVVTSCASSYHDWANTTSPGVSHEDGVEVHRLLVREPRDRARSEALGRRVLSGRTAGPAHLQREWMLAQGPVLDGLEPWLDERAPHADLVIFYTYLYYPTWVGLPVAARVAPTLLHPALHDEPMLRLPIFDVMFRHADAFSVQTPEERALLERRFRLVRPTLDLGIGVDVDAHRMADGARFRRRYGLGDSPYLVCVGRVDPNKGTDELVAFFRAYQERRVTSLRLVLVGEGADTKLVNDSDNDVIVTGYVDDATKHDALAGAISIVQPSYFESYSIALSEGWVHSRPALVQGRCAVLAGQARRSSGGLPYAGYASFEATLDRLLEDTQLAGALGRAGRSYVEQHYDWPTLLTRYESFLDVVATSVPTGRRSRAMA